MAPLGRADGLDAGRARSSISAAPSGTGSRASSPAKQPELPGDLDEDQPPYDPLTVVFTTDAPSAEVVTFYRDQCAQSEAVLATTPLSAAPLGKHRSTSEPPNVRWVVLHMIEETSRHAGHLDIARELLDGTTRLGGR